VSTAHGDSVAMLHTSSDYVSTTNGDSVVILLAY
jgi:hypothetical protein